MTVEQSAPAKPANLEYARDHAGDRTFTRENIWVLQRLADAQAFQKRFFTYDPSSLIVIAIWCVPYWMRSEWFTITLFGAFVLFEAICYLQRNRTIHAHLLVLYPLISGALLAASHLFIFPNGWFSFAMTLCIAAVVIPMTLWRWRRKHKHWLEWTTTHIPKQIADEFEAIRKDFNDAERVFQCRFTRPFASEARLLRRGDLLVRGSTWRKPLKFALPENVQLIPSPDAPAGERVYGSLVFNEERSKVSTWQADVRLLTQWTTPSSPNQSGASENIQAP